MYHLALRILGTHEFEGCYASLVAQMVKNLPAMQEIQVQSLGREDPLEKGMVPTPVFVPGESHGQRSLAGYSPWGCTESDTTEHVAHTVGCRAIPEVI